MINNVTSISRGVQRFKFQNKSVGCLNRDHDLLTINRAALVHTLMMMMLTAPRDVWSARGRAVTVEIRPDVQPGCQLLCVGAHALQMSVQRRVNVFPAVQSRGTRLRLSVRSESFDEDD